MKNKFYKLAALFVAGAFATQVGAQSVGDKLMSGVTKYEVIGENLITNGSFDDGVTGWFTADGESATTWIPAVSSNFTVTATGGFDNGAYITVSGEGSKSVKTLRNHIAVEIGKTYMFRCFTSGKSPSNDNVGYNGMWASEDGATEGDQLYALQWGAATSQTATSWTENTCVFTATKEYVCLRFGWNSSTNLDGFFLGEVELSETFANPISLGEWTSNCGTNSNQHWDGGSTSYFDNWNGGSASHSVSQNITLPAGEYVLKAAGRAQNTGNSNTYINVGDKKVFFRSKGDTGLGIETSGNENYASTGTYANNNAGRGWEWRYIYFTLDQETEVSLGGGYSINNSWAGLCAPELFTNDAAAKKVRIADIETLKSNGSALTSSKMNAEVSSTLTTELAKSYSTENTLDELNAGKEALETAIAAAESSIAVYAKINAYIANAKTFGIGVTAYETAYNDGTYTDVTGETARQELNVAIYNAASTAFNNEFELTGWTGEIGTASGQHWDGTSATSYYDTNGTNITRSLSKTATLPAGTFVFKAAGRSSVAATMSLVVNGQVVKFNAKGDTGYGIKIDGTADFAAPQEDGAYANENAGRGWEWEFVKFTLDEQTEVTLTATITTTGWAWGSFANVSLWMDDATFTNMLFNAAKDDLNAAITNTPTPVNVGNGAFQRSADSYSEVDNALVNANEVLSNGAPTVNDVNSTTEALEAAIEAYENAALNAPAADQKFNLVLKYAGWTYDGKAVTYIEGGRNDAGLYNIQYAAAPNANYAQAFTFTPVEGQTNCYTLSMTDVDGNERYICTGVPYGGNASQIRTTTTADDALVVKVIASSTVEGIYNLYNTAANNYIGSQDAGMYTVNSHIDFNIVEAEQAEVTLTVTEAGWATLMLPFNADVPAGLTVYTCDAVGEDNVLTLTEVEKIAANTPYVVESEAAVYEFAGYGLAKQDTYTGGIFTGTYAQMDAIVDSYVLQTQNDNTAFYKVAEGKQPNVGAYRCYVTLPSSNAPMFSLERGEGTTGIDNAAMTEAQTPVIYDLAGRRVEKLGKGIFIMNGKKVIVK